jgi:C-terminal processing protease CtpA/Prc
MFDDLWTQVDLHYSYFELRGVDWNAVRARYRPRAIAAKSDAQFASVLNETLMQLRDVHVALTANNVLYRYRSPYEGTTAIDESAIFARYVAGSFATSGGHIRGGFISPRIGYLRIASFVGEDWAGEMDEALARLFFVEVVIIDVRDNPGGSKTTATKIAGRFADRERTFGYVRLRNGARHDQFSDDIAETVKPEGSRHHAGRALVLSNRGCMSAAEDFILAMHALPTVTVVGDTTVGASGGPLVRELANGWTYQLSQWVAYTADHKTFEGVGLPPDVAVKAGSISGTDPVLDRAIALVR